MSDMRIALAAALLVTGCAAVGPTTGSSEESAKSPISCQAGCQTTFTQCSGGCIGGGADTLSTCQEICGRVLEDCLRTCEKPPQKK